MSASKADARPVRIIRIIARLNIGGPAIQAITLTQRLGQRGYTTTLVRGREEPDEGNMDQLARELGVHPMLVTSLRRNPGWRDLRALLALVRIIRRERPQIVHTHAAKAGTLGRLATVIAFPRRHGRPVLVHTYHGHSLSGYFAPRTAALYRQVERFLARFSDRLIAVSDEVRDELVKLEVANRDAFEVVPLGFDLRPFAVSAAERSERRQRLRRELGIADDDKLVTLIARLVPIKRVDRFLRVAERLGAQRQGVHFLVVGDGELRAPLERSTEANRLNGRLTWTGFRRDIPDVCFASDAVVLTSDNEGTPVSLIEAQAAGTPVVGTRVGGVASVVREGSSGVVVEPSDEIGMANALARLLDDGGLAERTVAVSGEFAQSFSLDALVARIDDLYRGVLGLDR